MKKVETKKNQKEKKSSKKTTSRSNVIDRKPRKIDMWTYVLNVLFFGGEVSYSQQETVCGIDGCTSDEEIEGLSKEELYTRYLANMEISLKERMEATYITFGDGQELGDFLTQGIDTNYYKIDRLLYISGCKTKRCKKYGTKTLCNLY